MRRSGAIERKRSSLRPYSHLLLGLWTVTVFGLLVWSVFQARESTWKLASHTARAHFDKDRAFRLWGASHGGIYVPVDDKTPPNPHLGHVEERDIRTPSGTRLTLMNPAYMIRQLQEEFSELYGVKGRITSLKPLRKENSPDEWERKALRSFERGKQEVIEFTEVAGERHLRLMRPFVTEKGCLKCHGHQGYKEGDVRGGIGVSLSLKPFFQQEHRQIIVAVMSHGLIFLIGFVGIVLGMKRLGRREEERNAVEAQLAKSEMFLQQVVENIPNMVFVKDADDLSFVSINQAGEELLGYSREDLLGRSAYDFFPREQADFFTSKDREAITKRGLLDIPEQQIQTRLKGNRIVHAKKIPILDSDGVPRYLLGISEDITDRKRAEEELIRSNQDLQQFAYVASHDLQEPLRNVVNCLEMLEKKHKSQLDVNAQEYISYAVEGATRMKALIQDLLEYSRVGTRGRRLQTTDCEQILKRAVNNLQPAISEAGASVTHDRLPIVVADEAQLLQVFQNLIANAIKFRGDKPPHVHVSAIKSNNEWIFSVKDNGIGIESEYLERIFVIFQRLHKRARYDGTGIGLAIAKKVVERHRGGMWVESEVGVGSTFHFTLPVSGVPKP